MSRLKKRLKKSLGNRRFDKWLIDRVRFERFAVVRKYKSDLQAA